MTLPEPRALVPDRDALFLDFDGTLVDIAPTPAEVRPAACLPDLLTGLARVLGGALAVISGRPVEEIDRFLAPCRLPLAGLHGRDRRLASGERLRAPVDPALVAVARDRLRALAGRHPGTLLEDKGESVALHYRQAPAAGPAVLEEARAVAEASGGRLRLIPGKMVAELIPAGFDKGTAIRLLLQTEPFAGRTPVFAGDDLTDEAGFVAVNALDGLSLRIGAAESTAARSLLPDTAALHAWLARAAGHGCP